MSKCGNVDCIFSNTNIQILKLELYDTSLYVPLGNVDVPYKLLKTDNKLGDKTLCVSEMRFYRKPV